eukprot:325803-Chlamydomonas_euryale.AAC.4
MFVRGQSYHVTHMALGQVHSSSGKSRGAQQKLWFRICSTAYLAFAVQRARLMHGWVLAAA